MKIIFMDGQKIYVTEEVYIVYTKGERKSKYFTEDLKRERMIVDQEKETIKIIPSREDSYERLTCDCEKEFADKSENTEDKAMMALMIEKMRDAVTMLTETEKQIIYGLFFENKTGKIIAEELGVSEMTISRRKRDILKKLRKFLEK